MTDDFAGRRTAAPCQIENKADAFRWQRHKSTDVPSAGHKSGYNFSYLFHGRRWSVMRGHCDTWTGLRFLTAYFRANIAGICIGGAAPARKGAQTNDPWAYLFFISTQSWKFSYSRSHSFLYRCSLSLSLPLFPSPCFSSLSRARFDFNFEIPDDWQTGIPRS